MVELSFTMEPKQEDIDLLMNLIRDANTEAGSGPDGYQHVAFFITDPASGKVTGGLYGYVLFDWLFVQFLAVPKAMRGQGVGTEILNKAEIWARERGLVGMWLDTFAFGAPQFYRDLGFAEFGTIEDHPIGSRRHFMMKRFVAPTA